MEYNRKNGDIVICLGLLGKGSFRVVKNHLSLLQLQMEVVGKQKITQVGDLDDLQARKEIDMLQHCKGEPNIAQLLESKIYQSPKKRQQVILTKAPFYNMVDLLVCMKDLTDQQKLKVAVDIIKGVIALHKKGIIHRDLKPENIFITKEVDGNGVETIKGIVGDIGLACWTKNDKDISGGVGSPIFMSPQKLDGLSSRVEDDYWAVGIILEQLFKGTFPMIDAKSWSELERITNNLSDRSKNPPPINKNSVQYVSWKLMQPNLSRRMNLVDALAIVEHI